MEIYYVPLLTFIVSLFAFCEVCYAFEKRLFVVHVVDVLVRFFIGGRTVCRV
jgi:hypothetical protein